MEHKKKDQESTSSSKYDRAVAYLRTVYGLEPEDVNLQTDDTVVEVDMIAVKYDLQPVNSINVYNKKKKPFITINN